MSDVTTTIKEMEDYRDNAKALLDRRNMALRLEMNPDFKKLILEEFCVKEAARFAQLSQDPALSKVQQKDALRLAQASGHLKRYLSVVVQAGFKASQEMPEIDEALVQMRAEEDAR